MSDFPPVQFWRYKEGIDLPAMKNKISLPPPPHPPTSMPYRSGSSERNTQSRSHIKHPTGGILESFFSKPVNLRDVPFSDIIELLESLTEEYHMMRGQVEYLTEEVHRLKTTAVTTQEIGNGLLDDIAYDRSKPVPFPAPSPPKRLSRPSPSFSSFASLSLSSSSTSSSTLSS